MGSFYGVSSSQGWLQDDFIVEEIVRVVVVEGGGGERVNRGSGGGTEQGFWRELYRSSHLITASPLSLERIGWGRGWLLLLLWQLTRAFAAQNHMCTRINRVETRVAVPVQEPATFRSYEWCLKVPPRCSKYTVVTRERITYQIEVRNETVAECCAGAISLYGVCVARCESCPNMLCDKMRNCTCAPGYLGPLCNQTCEAGKWGERCAETCICRVGEDCDLASGTCSPSTSTTASPTAPSPGTTPNTFVNLTVSGPTTSAEDLTEFNSISSAKSNNSVRTANGDDGNSVNALDLDYPVLPTDSVGGTDDERTYNDRPQTDSVNGGGGVVEPSGRSVVTAGWIGDLGMGTGQSVITVASALGLVALLAVAVAVVAVRRAKIKVATCPSPSPSPPPTAAQCLPLTAKGHYAMLGALPFTFSHGYGVDSEANEDSYDHPRSLRCLAASEPVYDELRY